MALAHKGVLAGRVTGKALEYGVCATAASAFLLFGYDQGIMSGILTEQSFLSTFPAMSPTNNRGAIQALVVAIYEIGCLLGSFFCIAVGDKIGRRRSVLLGTLVMLLGTAIQASSFGMVQMIVGRVITGAGNGMNTSSIPVWQSEMAPPAKRGFLVLFEGALIAAGIMISYWVNYGFWFMTDFGGFQWRFPIAIQGLFGVLILLGTLLYPESPRWLLKHGHDGAAREILACVRDTDLDCELLAADMDEIKRSQTTDSAGKLTVREFFANADRGMNLWRASIGFTAQAFQQLGGINLVTYYATIVFEQSLGFDPTMSRFMTGWLGTAYFIAAAAALFVVDRLGRRKLMIAGALGMALSLLAAAVGLSQSATPESSRAGAYVAAAMFFVFNCFFALGWLGVTWLYPAEVTPMRIRAEANGLSTSANWLFNYAVVQLAPIMIQTLKWKTYLVFMAFNLAFVPVVYFTFVETKGYKLERLDRIFAEAWDRGENPVWVEKRIRGGKALDIELQEGDGKKAAEG